ncbi:hypothetical protein SprV_0200580000 [Sparganum proliferum]
MQALRREVSFNTAEAKPVNMIAAVESILGQTEPTEEIKSLIRHQVSSLLMAHRPREVLSKVERDALRELKADKDLAIVPADKGRSTVVLDRTDYLQKAKANATRQFGVAYNTVHHCSTELEQHQWLAREVVYSDTDLLSIYLILSLFPYPSCFNGKATEANATRQFGVAYNTVHHCSTELEQHQWLAREVVYSDTDLLSIYLILSLFPYPSCFNGKATEGELEQSG